MHDFGRVSGRPYARIGLAMVDFRSASARVGRRQPGGLNRRRVVVLNREGRRQQGVVR